MYLVYSGPFQEVEVPHDDGSYEGAVIIAERGKAVDVSDAVAESLLSQGEENAEQIPTNEDGDPERAPQHDRTWRKATAAEVKAAQKAAGETETASAAAEPDSDEGGEN